MLTAKELSFADITEKENKENSVEVTQEDLDAGKDDELGF